MDKQTDNVLNYRSRESESSRPTATSILVLVVQTFASLGLAVFVGLPMLYCGFSEMVGWGNPLQSVRTDEPWFTRASSMLFCYAIGLLALLPLAKVIRRGRSQQTKL